MSTPNKTPDNTVAAAAIADTHTKTFTYHLLTAFWIATFYVGGVGTVTTSKIVMTELPFPFTLVATQFGMASVLTVAMLIATGQRRNGYPDIVITRLMILTGAVYALAFVLMTASMRWATAPLSETVRAMEPLATVLVGSLFLKERSSLHVLFSLLPICGGVMLSCASNAEFSLTGCLMVMLSNFAYAGRSVTSRLIQQLDPASLEPFNFFADLSMVGFLMLLPIAAVFEGSQLYSVLSASAAASGESGSTVYAGEGGVNLGEVLPALAMNAVLYSVYAVASFIILQRTDLITHAAINAFRRVFSILLTALYFGVELNIWNLTGIFVAFCGALLFTYFKSRESAATK